jgi:hypothetical protein
MAHTCMVCVSLEVGGGSRKEAFSVCCSRHPPPPLPPSPPLPIFYLYFLPPSFSMETEISLGQRDT